MTPNQLLKYFGTQQAIADAFGCSQASVAGWFAKGVVPEGRQYQAQIATFGVLMADKPALRNKETREVEGDRRIEQRRTTRTRRDNQ